MTASQTKSTQPGSQQPPDQPKSFQEEATALTKETKKIYKDAKVHQLTDFRLSNLKIGYKKDEKTNNYTMDPSLPYAILMDKMDKAQKQAMGAAGAQMVVDAATGKTLSLNDYQQEFSRNFRRVLEEMHEAFLKPDFNPSATPPHDWEKLEKRLDDLGKQYNSTINSLQRDASGQETVVKAQADLLAAFSTPPTGAWKTLVTEQKNQVERIHHIQGEVKNENEALERVQATLKNTEAKLAAKNGEMKQATGVIEKEIKDKEKALLDAQGALAANRKTMTAHMKDLPQIMHAAEKNKAVLPALQPIQIDHKLLTSSKEEAAQLRKQIATNYRTLDEMQGKFAKVVAQDPTLQDPVTGQAHPDYKAIEQLKKTQEQLKKNLSEKENEIVAREGQVVSGLVALHPTIGGSADLKPLKDFAEKTKTLQEEEQKHEAGLSAAHLSEIAALKAQIKDKTGPLEALKTTADALKAESEQLGKEIDTRKSKVGQLQDQLSTATDSLYKDQQAAGKDLKLAADKRVTELEAKLAAGAGDPEKNELSKLKTGLDDFNTKQSLTDKGHQQKEAIRKAFNEQVNNMQTQHAAEMHYLRTKMQDKDLAQSLHCLFLNQSLKMGGGWDGAYNLAGLTEDNKDKYKNLGLGAYPASNVGTYDAIRFTPNCNYMTTFGNIVYLNEETDKDGKATGLISATCRVSKWYQSEMTNFKEGKREEMLILLKAGAKNFVMGWDQHSYGRGVSSSQTDLAKRQKAWLMTALNFQYNIFKMDSLPKDPKELEKFRNSMVITKSGKEAWAGGKEGYQLHVIDDNGKVKTVHLTSKQVKSMLPENTIPTTHDGVEQYQFKTFKQFKNFNQSVIAADSRLVALQQLAVTTSTDLDKNKRQYAGRFVLTIDKEGTPSKDVFALHSIDDFGNKTKSKISTAALERILSPKPATGDLQLTEKQLGDLKKELIAQDRQLLSGTATTVSENGDVRMISSAKVGLDSRTIGMINSQAESDDDRYNYLRIADQQRELEICNYIIDAKHARDDQVELQQAKKEDEQKAPAVLSSKDPAAVLSSNAAQPAILATGKGAGTPDEEKKQPSRSKLSKAPKKDKEEKEDKETDELKMKVPTEEDAVLIEEETERKRSSSIIPRK